MKQLNLLLALTLLSTLAFAQSLENFLNSQPEIKNVEKIEGHDFFTATYKIMVEQPIDHQDPNTGTFTQRVFVADKAIDRPMVFITEGYNGGYAGRPGHASVRASRIVTVPS